MMIEIIPGYVMKISKYMILLLFFCFLCGNSIYKRLVELNVVIMDTTAFDLKVDEKISMTCSELVRRIVEPNGINIVF